MANDDETPGKKPTLTAIDGGKADGARKGGGKAKAPKEPAEPGRGARVAGAVVAGALGRMERAARATTADPARGEKRDGVAPGQWAPDTDGMPPGCPVRPLGVEGRVFHMVDALGKLFSVGGDHGAFGQEAIRQAFAGRIDYAYWAWPQWSKDGAVTGIKATEVQDTIYDACARKGLWSPADKVRGRGAWAEGPREASRLVYHCGDHIWTGNQASDTGPRGGYFYPRAEPLPAPWPRPVEDDDNPAASIVEMFRAWDWARPDIDPLIMTGWVMAAVVAGALDWRPSVWIVSDAGAGKSTLQRMVREVLKGLIVAAENTTAAGLYQHLAYDARPVSLDELEYAPNQAKRIEDIVSLARIAASGGTLRRGGADHSGTQFTSQSIFLFSSINVPPLPAQDLSRMAVLRLRPLDAGRKPVAAPAMMETILPRLMRRMADRWREFRPLLDHYRTGFFEAGHSQRSQDTHGVFLALAHLALGDETMERMGFNPNDARGYAEIIGHEAKPKSNWRQAIDHLLSRPIEAFTRGTRKTVGQVLYELHHREEGMTPQAAAELLGAAGLGIKLVDERNLADGWWLAVPSSGLVTQLFAGSIWEAGPTGAAGFTEAIRQGPPEVVSADKAINRVTVSGMQMRCTMVRWLVLFGME